MLVCPGPIIEWMVMLLKVIEAYVLMKCIKSINPHIGGRFHRCFDNYIVIKCNWGLLKGIEHDSGDCWMDKEQNYNYGADYSTTFHLFLVLS